MRRRIAVFCLAALAPYIGSGGAGCNGLCGSCQFSCVTGVGTALFLLGRVLTDKFRAGRVKVKARYL